MVGDEWVTSYIFMGEGWKGDGGFWVLSVWREEWRGMEGNETHDPNLVRRKLSSF